ncbi:unnamed protein product [Ceutorhynchus assimilis]|uniref:BTB domain-containing protein n=1 Tax=Ceutorhynchus assimilis TaxID=467358 RepID=A0A9N9MT51_9CUCU|nr:unnamed protein product [Ceutorhynchus assimilis]
MIMETQNETVILEIESTTLECNKALLINNSDYFRAMLTGNFKESAQEIIKIQEVDLKSFKTILSLLQDDRYIVDDKELHLILQVACMLQFSSIKQLCETRIMEILNPSICLPVWKTTESLDISPHWLKAKSMALEEFTNISDSQISELGLDDVCKYLGNLYLNVKCEFAVFQKAMNWWYENQEHFKGQKVDTILRLLNCIDFKTIQDNEVKEMQTYPDIANNEDIISILNCLVVLRANANVETFSEKHINFAKHFLNCESRKKPLIPCILFKGETVYANTCRDICQQMINVVVADTVSKDPETVFQIDMDKMRNLVGYKLTSYKEFVFLYGGEYFMGIGNWNFNFWAYDTFKGKWERKSKLPQERRHFESAIVDHCIYLIGGIGKFRVVQENMVWYDFIADKWSPVIPLPSTNNRNFQCCSFNGKLCMVYSVEKRAYLYDKEKTNWTQIEIQIDNEIVPPFRVVSDDNYLYILRSDSTGNYCVRLKLEKNKFVPTKQIYLNSIKAYSFEVVLCNDTIYSFYIDDGFKDFQYTFESLNLKTEAVECIFQNNRKPFHLTKDNVLFSVNYYSFVKEDNFINNQNVF